MTIYRKAQRTSQQTAALLTLSEVSLGALLLVVLGASLPHLVSSLFAWGIAMGLYLLIAGLVMAFWSGGPLGWANRVTLMRAVLITIVTAAVWTPLSPLGHWQWLGVALIALLLDGVDGWVARRTGSQTAFGARFDMELDALLILLLCIGVMLKTPAGAWVLLIGCMRYGFVAAGWRLPWLQEALYDSLRRKAVCVWQIAALLLALVPWASAPVAPLLALSALVALTCSFGVDTLWLYRQHALKRR